MPNTERHTPAKQLSRHKRVLFTLIAAIGTFLVCFGLMEALARLTRPTIDLYALTGRIPGPNPMAAWALTDAFAAYRGKPGNYGEGKTVNSHGFISTPEIALEKAPGARRLVFLGGSSTAGTGWLLPDAMTWPWLTVDRLLRDKPETRYDFINGALGGYSSFESFGLLWSRLIHFKPDVVILNHGWNEMYYFNQADDILSWRMLPDGSWGFEQTRQPIPVFQPRWVDPLVSWSQLLTVLRLSLSSPNKGEIAPVVRSDLKTAFNQQGLNIWRTHLKLFRETCRVQGIALLVIKQPTLIVPGLSPELQRRCRYEFHGFDHDAHVAAYAALHAVIDEEISPEAIIDLTAISGNPDYFYDHVHPNPTGTRVIAKLVAAALSKHLAGDG